MAPCDFKLLSFGTVNLKIEKGALISEDFVGHYINKFYDGKKFRISREQLAMGKTEWKEVPPERYFASCGGGHSADYFDEFGRCSITLNSVHTQHHKLFWARFIQHGKVPW